MERRRPRHPHPEAGQGGVREVAVEGGLRSEAGYSSEIGRSVGGPHAGRQEFEQVTVRIPKIDALPSPRPQNAAQNFDAVGMQMSFPLRQFLAGHSKCHMKRSCAVMRWNGSPRKVCFPQGCAADKEQQDVLRRNIERAESFVLNQGTKSKDTIVELLRPFQIVDVKRGFFQIIESWHSQIIRASA
jgi:hypothetical protein